MEIALLYDTHKNIEKAAQFIGELVALGRKCIARQENDILIVSFP